MIGSAPLASLKKCARKKLKKLYSIMEIKPLTRQQIKAIGDWLLNGEHGQSSLTMAGVFMGGTPTPIRPPYPHDTGDFHRCIQFVHTTDTLNQLPRMLVASREWRVVIENWENLKLLYEKVLECESYSLERVFAEKKFYKFMKNLGL